MVSFPCTRCGRKLEMPTHSLAPSAQCPWCGGINSIAVAERSEPSTIPPSEVPTLPPSDDAVSQSRKAEAEDDRQPVYSFLAQPHGHEEIGRLGPYSVLQVLGAGGMGVVFLARDGQLDRLVALKAMLPVVAAQPAARQRFLREARSTAAVEHDHVVSILHVGEEQGVPFLAMPFLRGEPLNTRLQRGGKLPLAEVLRIGWEAAEGLAAAHERGLIHRDIKPANIWLEGERGRVKILDFGLARSSSTGELLTEPGLVFGTPNYMSPEQANGQTLDARSDLFSLGCVLYEMATGHQPFPGNNALSVLRSVVDTSPLPPRKVDPELPPALADVIEQLLQKNPAHRPATTRAVASILRSLEAPGITTRMAQSTRHWRRWLWLALVVLAIACLAGLLWAWGHFGAAPRGDEPPTGKQAAI